MKILQPLKSEQKGFTLIELLVVVAILGTLSAVAIPNLSKFMNHGKTEAAGTELAIVQTAVAAYMYDNNGNVPADEAALSPYFVTPLHGTYSFGSDGKATQEAYS